MKDFFGIALVVIAWLLTWGVLTAATIYKIFTDDRYGWPAVFAIAVLSVIFYYGFDWYTDKKWKKIALQQRNPEVVRQGVWLKLMLLVGVLARPFRKLRSSTRPPASDGDKKEVKH